MASFLRRLPSLTTITLLCAGAAFAQQAAPSTADPYANNPDAGKLQFPLAAPKGVDSGAITKALPKGVNQGMVDPATWKYGPAWNPPANSKIWFS